jgi:hypothetical protein
MVWFLSYLVSYYLLLFLLPLPTLLFAAALGSWNEPYLIRFPHYPRIIRFTSLILHSLLLLLRLPT